ncbi:MAG: hypothetical protein KGL39_27825 [Patescibacteria group bacterium]|nr:hypothetical protein [Patescibacteria group bacterium]
MGAVITQGYADGAASSPTPAAKNVYCPVLPGVPTAYGHIVDSQSGATANVTAMKADGITVVLADGFLDPVTQIETLLTACDTVGGISCAYECNIASDQVVADIIAAIQAYVTQAASHSSAFKASDGRLVVFIYGTNLISASDWATVRAAVTADVYLVGMMGANAWSTTPMNQSTATAYMANWDALWDFFPPSSVNLPTVLSLCAAAGKDYIWATIPQYYGSSGYSQPNDGGVTYAAQWTAAISAGAAGIAAICWNDNSNDLSAITPVYEAETATYAALYKAGGAMPTVFPVRHAITVGLEALIRNVAVPSINASLAASYSAQGVPSANRVSFSDSQVRRGDLDIVTDPVIDIYMGRFTNSLPSTDTFVVVHWTTICLKMIAAQPPGASGADSLPEDYELIKTAFVDNIFDALTAGAGSFAMDPNSLSGAKPLPAGTNLTGCYPDSGGPIPAKRLLNGVSVQHGYAISHRATISYPLTRPYALTAP